MQKQKIALALSLALGHIGTSAADTFIVNSAASGTDASEEITTFADAMEAAASTPGEDTIQFDSSLDGSTVSLQEPFVIGDSLIINGGGNITLSFDNNLSYFDIYNESSKVDLSLQGLALITGEDEPPVLIDDRQNAGNIAIQNCTLDGKSQTNVAGIKANGANLAITGSTIKNFVLRPLSSVSSTDNTVFIANSTFTNNHHSSGGGAIYVYQSGAGDTTLLSVVNSTITANSGFIGGGIYLAASVGAVQASLQHITVTGNNASFEGGGIHTNTQDGGTIDLNLANAIVANNTTDGGDNDLELSDGTTAVAINSIIENNTQSASTTNVNVRSVDPLLGTLTDNGGPTQTMLPQTGSPAINTGIFSASVPRTDQRGSGYSRYRGSAPDIGAVEVQQGADYYAEDDSADGGSTAASPLWLSTLLLPWLRRRKK